MAQSPTSIVYLATTQWPEPTLLPVNGQGGQYYDDGFTAPVYDPEAPGVQRQISWAVIDFWGWSTANVLATEGICLGLCLTTLFYVIALTPAKKRGKPFHTFLILALLCQIFHSLCELIQGTKAGMSQFSSYLFLTLDYDSTTYSAGFRTIRILSLIASCFTIAFALICLGIQSNGLLSGVRIKHPKVYRCLMWYLYLASCAAVSWRLVYAVLLSILLGGNYVSFNDGVARQGLLIVYTISIGSWSLVSLCSTCWLIWTRTKTILSPNRIYNSVLNLIALICVESFIVPLIFCILQLVPRFEAIVQPKIVVIPSVLVLLPLGSLFMTVHEAEVSEASNASNATNVPLQAGNGGAAHALQDLSLPSPLPQLRSAVPSPVDRELQSIDAIAAADEAEHSELPAGSYGTDKISEIRAEQVRRSLNVGAGVSPGPERKGRSFV